MYAVKMHVDLVLSVHDFVSLKFFLTCFLADN